MYDEVGGQNQPYQIAPESAIKLVYDEPLAEELISKELHSGMCTRIFTCYIIPQD